MEKAGFGQRFVALLIDGIAIYLIALVLTWAISLLTGGGADSLLGGILGRLVSSVLIAIMLLLDFLYYGFMWSRSGQSVGMKLMHIRVVDHQTGGREGLVKAGLRGTVGYFISGLIFGLGFLWAAFDANGEAWHDKIFSTRVVKA
jgi:uncharacterized RDD family membrane protein YckC